MTKVQYSFFNGAIVLDTYAKAKEMSAKTKMPYKVEYIPIEENEPAAGWKKSEPSIK